MSYRTVYKARLHRKSVSSRNPFPLVLVFWDQDSKGPWSKLFRNRGIDPKVLAERDVTTEENSVLLNSWQLRYVQYASWDSLIKDEDRIVADPKWTAKLRDLALVRA